MAAPIMFQGTSSNVGKSIITAGFCRILLEAGISVAPFKAQNMALNSFVTHDGLEMGRAQVTQAAACRIEPDVRMNPVLLKPSAGKGSQVVVMGKPYGNINMKTYPQLKEELRAVVRESYEYLDSRYDVIVIEGAGSPAEVNLKKDDIVNMHMAKLAQSPVVIVGDIDRGGVYAHFVGTYELLDPDEQELTAGFLINKFRGDASLLTPANEFIEKRTGKKLFGVVPMIQSLRLPDEDSVEFKKRVGQENIPGIDNNNAVNIALIDLPHISNFTDFDAFTLEPDVCLFVTHNPEDLLIADIIMIPGSKNTLHDMKFLIEKGFAPVLTRCVNEGKMVVGICGGYQMLGQRMVDTDGIESGFSEINGFGFLDLVTEITPEKKLSQVSAVCTVKNLPVRGYEIHHGSSRTKEKVLLYGKKGNILGVRNTSGNVWGTYIHGVFDSGEFRKHILDIIRKKKGIPVPEMSVPYDIDSELTRLASILKDSIDLDALYRMLGI